MEIKSFVYVFAVFVVPWCLLIFPPSLLLLAVLDGRDVVSRCVGVLL